MWIILLGLSAILVGLALWVARQPDSFWIERSALIAAPPTRVFAEVNDFHRWHRWSPWAKRDLAMQVSYSGPASGVGAVYHWVGNRQVGEGRATIVAEFYFQAEDGGTRVNWSMTGRSNFISKAMGLLCNMDKMVGADFEQGLAQLGALAEAA
ncbi:MAG: SRPBCC family protein [Pseudomonas sp.]|uniref:SRPBCC family protein n=1 Tax=Pseudomonas sp. TaxID=306 RepID=UPI003BB652AA